MDTSTLKKMILLSAILLSLLACELPVLSAPATPGLELVPVETIIAGTAAAARTQTAIMLPSPTVTATITPLPTNTNIPTETIPPTATFIFVIPTSTPPFVPHSVGSQCDLIAMTPYLPIVDPGSKFDTLWTLKNTSNESWLMGSVDFKFSSGTDMHSIDGIDIATSVGPTAGVTLTVPISAPQNSGTYTTNWVLSSGNKTLCKVSTTVTVK